MKSQKFLELLTNECGEKFFSSPEFNNKYLISYPIYAPNVPDAVNEIVDKINSDNYDQEDYRVYLSYDLDSLDRFVIDSEGEVIVLTYEDLLKSFYEELTLGLLEKLEQEFWSFSDSLITCGSLNEVSEEIQFWKIGIEKYVNRFDNGSYHSIVTNNYKKIRKKLAGYWIFLENSNPKKSNGFTIDAFLKENPMWGTMPSIFFKEILSDLILNETGEGFISTNDFNIFLTKALGNHNFPKIKLSNSNKANFIKPFCLLKRVNEVCFAASNKNDKYINLILDNFEYDGSYQSIYEYMKKINPKITAQYSEQVLRGKYKLHT